MEVGQCPNWGCSPKGKELFEVCICRFICVHVSNVFSFPLGALLLTPAKELEPLFRETCGALFGSTDHCHARGSSFLPQVTNNDTMYHLTNTRDKHIDTITKVNHNLFLHVVDMLNARYGTYFIIYRCTLPVLCAACSCCRLVLRTMSTIHEYQEKVVR
jgi:hypothetical protein